MIYPTIEQVLVSHELLIDRFGGSSGVRDIRMLESALFRPQTTFGGEDLYQDIFTKAAALIHGIIKNHPFVDGNKRTGMHTGIFFLKLNNLEINIKRGQIVDMAVKIAEGSVTIEDITAWLKETAI